MVILLYLHLGLYELMTLDLWISFHEAVRKIVLMRTIPIILSNWQPISNILSEICREVIKNILKKIVRGPVGTFEWCCVHVCIHLFIAWKISFSSGYFMCFNKLQFPKQKMDYFFRTLKNKYVFIPSNRIKLIQSNINNFRLNQQISMKATHNHLNRSVKFLNFSRNSTIFWIDSWRIEKYGIILSREWN